VRLPNGARRALAFAAGKRYSPLAHE